MTTIMAPSSQDSVHLAAALETRFLDLCATYKRTNGTELPISHDIRHAVIAWRKVVIRFKQGDFRNSPDEDKAMKEFAQWLVDQNNTLKGQPPKTVEWFL